MERSTTEDQPDSERIVRRNVGAHTLPTTIGRYKVREHLATGRTAELFKASTLEPHGFEQVVVIKRLVSGLVRDPVQVKRFVEVAETGARLQHRNLVEVVEDRSDVDPPYFVMAYVDGLDLAAVEGICAARGVRVPPILAAFVVREVLAGLEHAHAANVVHRDVSPGNVIVSWSGDVKLVDIGELDATPGYAAPEQRAGRADARSDVFAAGLVLAELVMARRLLEAGSDREDRLDALHEDDAFPIELLAMTLRALQHAPEDRWPSATEFREALDAWLAGTGATQLELAVFLCELSNDEPSTVEPAGDTADSAIPTIEVDEGITHRMPTSVVVVPVEVPPGPAEQSRRFAHGTRAQPAIVMAPPPVELGWRWWHWAIGASLAALLGGALAYLV